jgi:Zn-finger nucleic acid-binding protein
MGMTDDEWVAAARARVAAGANWERPADDVFASLRASAAARQAPPAGPRCPYCKEHPALRKFPASDLITAEPVMFCPRCYGVWVTGDALAGGMVVTMDNHALTAIRAQPRCRACGGHLRDDESCVKCGEKLPPLNCPQCSKQMERFEQGGVKLDQCKACRGTWFDIGEFAAVYALERPKGLTEEMVEQYPPAMADVEPWEVGLQVGAQLLLALL